MRYEYIDPFVNAAVRVLNSAIPETGRDGNVIVVRGDQLEGDVTVVIQVAGESEGEIMFCMDTNTAARICSVLTNAATDSLDGAAQDVLSELGNMIAGNSVSSLNDLGFDFTMQAPHVMINGSYAGYRDAEVLQIPLASGCGKITMNVLLTTN